MEELEDLDNFKILDCVTYLDESLSLWVRQNESMHVCVCMCVSMKDQTFPTWH